MKSMGSTHERGALYRQSVELRALCDFLIDRVGFHQELAHVSTGSARPGLVLELDLVLELCREKRASAGARERATWDARMREMSAETQVTASAS